MARQHTLLREQRIALPREQVFPFFADAANLQRLTPAFLDFQFVTPLPIEMKPGTLIEYRIRLGPWPMRWVTRIDAFDAPHGFVDSQIAGPYRRWVHHHEFITLADGSTLMRDRVDYQLPLGPLGEVGHPVIARMLARIFDHRHAVLPGLLGVPTAATSVGS